MMSIGESSRVNHFAEAMIEAECERQNQGYAKYHARRFDYLCRLSRRLRPSREAAVLDIGRSYLSCKLAEWYDDVTTLGFPLEQDLDAGHRQVAPDISRAPRRHIVFDLNEAQHYDSVGDDAQFDLIVFAETIEHLHTAPELVLHCLANSLKPDGLIICQTPNAASLRKRLQALAGLNPYERIRCNFKNPGHFREYTKRELIEIGEAAGLVNVEHAFADYFGVHGGRGRQLLAAAAEAIARVAKPLSRGQTIVYGKAPGSRKRSPSG
jgi:2-polyprenyl-3-methyl-5-hydroxy-6-metoxy-1,4-benzoquinol methylase